MVKFGLTLSSDDNPEVDSREHLATYLRRATTARDVGFDAIAVGNRYSYGPARSDERGEPLTTSRFQPLTLASYLSGHLGDTIDYTALVLSPSLHPVQLAEDVATVDAMTGGRLTLVMALGWMPYEFEAFGIDMKSRGRRFGELIESLRMLLTQDEVTYEGEFFQFRSSRLVARPVQRPHPPIWIGASADAAVLRAARLGDSWTITSHAVVDELVRQNEMYLAELERLGRPVPAERPMSRMVYVAKDREAALEHARPALAKWYKDRGEWGWFVTQGQSNDEEVLSSGRWLIGSPDDIVQQVGVLQDRLGITKLNMSMTWPSSDETQRLQAIELLGEHVLPHFRT